MTQKEKLQKVLSKLKEIKRYDSSISGGCECCGSWVEHDEDAWGDWVKHEDIQAIIDDLEKLVPIKTTP